jgi:hypothetical protein
MQKPAQIRTLNDAHKVKAVPDELRQPPPVVATVSVGAEATAMERFAHASITQVYRISHVTAPMLRLGGNGGCRHKPQDRHERSDRQGLGEDETEPRRTARRDVQFAESVRSIRNHLSITLAEAPGHCVCPLCKGHAGALTCRKPDNGARARPSYARRRRTRSVPALKARATRAETRNIFPVKSCRT